MYCCDTSIQIQDISKQGTKSSFGEAFWMCKVTHDRDILAANNIKKLGLGQPEAASGQLKKSWMKEETHLLQGMSSSFECSSVGRPDCPMMVKDTEKVE